MAFSDEQLTTMRQKLGLAENADEATILAALDEALEERAESTAAAGTTIPDGHVVIPKAQLDDLTTGAEAGRQAGLKLQLKERQEFLDANRTKFAPANRASWEKEYDRDPEGTRSYFAEAPEIIPADMLGHEHDAEEQSSSSDVVAQVRESDAYKNWSLA